MTASFIDRLRETHRRNVQTLRRDPWAEISGALGDLGTLLPLMLALALRGSIHLDSTLVFSGVFNVATGVAFGIPLPVQPMKARHPPIHSSLRRSSGLHDLANKTPRPSPLPLSPSTKTSPPSPWPAPGSASPC